MNTHTTKQSGFTLVEVLVSLFIFALLSSSTLAVLTTTIKNKQQMAEKSTAIQERTLARILLKSDFAHTVIVPKFDSFAQPEPILFGGGNLGDNRVLSLSRIGWDNPGGLEKRSGLQAVEYVLEDGVLIRRTRARFNGVQTSTPSDQALVHDMNAVKFLFYDGEEWVENWIVGEPPLGVETLPVLASVEFTFADDNKTRQIFWVGADQ
ncbi:MAG TPA: type II secretion system protein GspJ [Hellea balneolensis]|uniref:Type II secretion system protein J n=1 Tax=Hellea balneolensis TaxID=287478 RepID=A0A7C3GA66_9PROT|nr:type II secretion system protein GspJ [Hellea balneolensis]